MTTCSEYQRAWRLANRERLAAYKRAYYLANREWWLNAEANKKRIAWAKANPEIGGEATKAWEKRNPEKRRAHWAVKAALRTGALVKPDACLKCGTGQTEAHHPDYSKPLEVVWLCRPCHGIEHRSRS
jgi:hypothetical protein